VKIVPEKLNCEELLKTCLPDIVIYCLAFATFLIGGTVFADGTNISTDIHSRLLPLLSANEKAWIVEHNTIRVGGPRSFPPFHYYEKDGILKGISSDYTRLLADRIGLKLNIQPSLPWPDVLEKARQKQIDIIACIVKTPERNSYLNFSKPYLSFPMVIIARKNAPFIGSLNDLYGKKVALIRKVSTNEWLKRDQVEIKPHMVGSPLEALEAVATGRADAYIGNLAATSYLIEKNGLSNLKVSAPTPYGNYDLHFAIRKDWPIMIPIFNKALETVTPEEHAAIRNRWLSIRYEYGISKRDITKLILLVVGVSGLVLVVILIWNKKLRVEIREREIIQTSLNDANIRFRQLAENIKEVFWIVSPDWKVVHYISPAYEKIWGRTCESLYDRPLFWLETVVKEDRDKIGEYIEKKASRSQFEIIFPDYRILRPDGGIRWIFARGFPVENASGQIDRVVGIAEDITARKHYDEAIRKIALEEPYQFGRKYFETIVLRLHEILEADYTFIGELTQNQEAVRTISLCVDGTIGENFEYVLHNSPCEDVVEKSICSYKEKTAERFPKDELLTEMGVEGYIGVPLFDRNNKPLGIMVALYRNPVQNEKFAESFLQLIASRAAAEIERTRMEEALRFSEKRFRDISLSMADWIWEVDKDGKYTYASDTVTNVLGYSANELIGKTPFELMTEDEAGRMSVIFSEIVARSGPIHDLENWNVAKDGTYVCLLTNGIPIFDEQGKLVGYRGIDKDITIQKKLETEKEKIESELQQAQKMESIGTLAGGIAHDFNNILGIILGNTELAIDDLRELNPARDYLEEVRAASLRAKDVVRQLLSFARKTQLEKKPTNIFPIIKETLQLLRASIPTSIEIRQNIQKDVDIILADPTQINQVLINLCTNADHAMPDGGIIVVTLKNVEFVEDFAVQNPELNQGCYVSLTISDTGSGISQEEIERIFDPYYTTKEVGKGTGMGLAVVHGIVKGHNGSITVESEPGKGTTISIFFPVIEEDAVIAIETDEKLPTGSERILFIDDEELIAKLGRQRLERLGYTVEATTSPIDALTLFGSRPDEFDLVITDLTMPKMTGDKLIKEILNIRQETPIILCTGFSEKINEKEAKAIGASDYIEKPLDRRDFAFKVRQVLDGKKG